MLTVTAIQRKEFIARQQCRFVVGGSNEHPTQGEIHLFGDRFGHYKFIALCVLEDNPEVFFLRSINTRTGVIQGQCFAGDNRPEGRPLHNHRGYIQ